MVRPVMLSSFHLVLFSSRQRLQGRLILPGTLTGDALFELVPSAVVVAVAAAAASALLRTPCGDPSPAPDIYSTISESIIHYINSIQFNSYPLFTLIGGNLS